MRLLMCIMALGLFDMAQAQIQPVKNGKELSSRQIVEYLASDSLEGRFPGSRGDSLARSFIVGRMEELGLEPCLETPDGEKTYFQPFQLILSRKVEGENFLRIGKDPVGETEMELGADYYPASFSGNGCFSGPAVGIGWGLQINGGSGRMDDYGNVDVKGKCVVITDGLPPRLAAIVNGTSEKEVSAPTDNGSGLRAKSGAMPSRMTEEIKALGNARNKALTAQDRGAAAVILIASSAGEENGSEEDLVWTASKDFPVNIPVVKVSRRAAEKMFPELIAEREAVGKGIYAANTGNGERKDVRVRLGVAVSQVAAAACNIVGMVPGRTDEYIVIGAHYDHLGYGGSGSGSRRPDTTAIHPGADDNASGIAGILYLARKYSGTVPEKGLIFAAFGAEEEGVVGSKYFADHLPVPWEKVEAMFNFDMIGNLRGSALSVGGTGTALQTDSLLGVASRVMPGLKIKSSPEGHGPSDHASFYAKKLPVFYFTSGGTLDYHTPEDKADRLNYAGLDSIAAFAGVLMEEVMKLPRGLSFREAGNSGTSPMRGGFKVTLGLMPDVTGSSNDGLRAEVVVKGKPADRAGMKSGDVIIEINGLSVSNIEDYMARLRTLRAGEIAKVKVRRGGEVLQLEIRL